MKSRPTEMTFWLKWRPNNINDFCLPQRIKQILEKGVQKNFIFYGPPGRGKTSLALFMSKDQPYKLINLGNEGSLDELKDKLHRFCTEFNLLDVEKPGAKVVIFDEFERASSALQESLRGFIEEHTNTRFIITTNNINKMDNAIYSRMGCDAIDFEFSSAEKKEVKNLLGHRMTHIASQEEVSIDVNKIKDIIKKYFPDMRLCIEAIHSYKIYGEVKTYEQSYEDCYNMILQKPADDVLWNFITENYITDLEPLWTHLGTPFFKWCRKTHPTLNPKISPMLLKYIEFAGTNYDHVDPLLRVLTICYFYKNIL